MLRRPQFVARLSRSLIRRVGLQMDHQQLEPWLVLACHYVGVLLWTLLPSAAAALLFPAMVGAVILSPIAAVPLAVIVFDRRGYRRWVAGRHRVLSVRVLLAISDGVMWISWCGRV
jgi:hypothetical protein